MRRPFIDNSPFFAMSRRSFTVALLVGALALGGWLRLGALATREMSADEAASWAAAAAPGLGEVMRRQAALNPGKLAEYEILLHGWMALAGDGLAAMRSLSAALGTVGIVLVFLIVREMLNDDVAPRRPNGASRANAPPPAAARPQLSFALGGMAAREAETVAALAALVFAVNLVTIKYSRELRMYALALLIVLAQIWFFLRSVRRAGGFNLASLAVLTAMAAGVHFTAVFVVAAEALCLPVLPSPARTARIGPLHLPVSVSVALCAGVVMFVAFAAPALRAGVSALDHGATSWIELPPWWEPFALFNKGTGTFAFPVMAVLAVWGAWRGWSRAPGAVAFAMVWMWLPPILLLLMSYVWSPIFVERYVLWCFVPFFILVALGVWNTRSPRAGAGAICLAVVLALGHIHAYRARPHGIQWREASRLAARDLAPGAMIAVGPPYAVNVVRYYLRNTPAAGAARPAAEGIDTRVLIADERWIKRGKAAKVLPEYPETVARFRGVRVQHRRHIDETGRAGR